MPTPIPLGRHLCRGRHVTAMKYPVFSEDTPTNQHIDDSLQLFSFKRRYQVPFFPPIRSVYRVCVTVCGRNSKLCHSRPYRYIYVMLCTMWVPEIGGLSPGEALIKYKHNIIIFSIFEPWKICLCHTSDSGWRRCFRCIYDDSRILIFLNPYTYDEFT